MDMAELAVTADSAFFVRCPNLAEMKVMEFL